MGLPEAVGFFAPGILFAVYLIGDYRGWHRCAEQAVDKNEEWREYGKKEGRKEGFEEGQKHQKQAMLDFLEDE
jgi:hypothetical protein